MTFDELWAHIRKRNPAMDAERITMSRDNLMKLCKAFYYEGANQSGQVDVFTQFLQGKWGGS